MIRVHRGLVSLVAREHSGPAIFHARRLACSVAAPKHNVERTNVSTSVHDSFTVPMTLVDVHLRDEQLPFAYFFEETLNAAELKSSLARVLKKYPVLGGKVNLTTGTIECRPSDSVSISFSQSELTLKQWLAESRPHRMTPGRPAQVLSPLFDCLLPNPDDESHQNGRLASIRVTHFSDGGTVLGVNLSHALADAASCVRFVQCWGREMQGLEYPHASNRRSHATCSGMLSPELLDVLDLNGIQKQQHRDAPWSLTALFLPLGVDWSDRRTNGHETKTPNDMDVNEGSHEYVSLKFTPQLLQAMKAHGMAHCGGTDTDFVSTNDVLTAFGWLMKRQLSGQADSNMSMVVNLRGRGDVDDFSRIDDADGGDGVFGNGITSIIAQLPSSEGRDILKDMSAAAVKVRVALSKGLLDIPDRLMLSRHGRPSSTPSLSLDCFAITSWQQFPLYDISFSATAGITAFRGYPSHPLPEGDTYNSIIVPEKCGSHTYQLLAPSNKVQDALAFHDQMCSLFLTWYGNHTSNETRSHRPTKL